ncbi:MAG: type II secretion system protein [Deltaproteobacteria bacterium]|nr:type II secretion system protein [Deltaproteobacteria bacterium]
MKSRLHENNGFTLIEVIASLLLVGVISVFAGIGISMIIDGYSLISKNAEITHKGQLAMTRLTKELTYISSVSSGTATAISYSSYKQDVLNSHNVSWVGDRIFLDGNPLSDSVGSFDLGYYDSYNSAKQTSWSAGSRIIEITLNLVGANNNNIILMTRVVPRNI